ncbi:phage tail protein [Wolbachia endosymbiont of Folsomia candida]|uniref:phage tail protein n=1 Tax=Wolbachia endosymbiont of Folsomia candida TaxID=169402 RepID=UPI000AC6C8F0|nr:phage tail protein [Wolbachia endosymbiont of Folsomia candida]APR98663.1 phage tail protein [Wolbachia endosymbiont of Folsomia candida]
MLNIKANNINQVTKDINAQESKIRLAAVRALNKTALWLKSQAAKEISKEKQIKLTVIRKKLRIIKARASTLEVIVKANFYNVKAHLLGGMKQTKVGAKAGKHMFTNAFIATMPMGHRGIFKRKGRASLPIQEVKLPLEPEATKIIEELVIHEVEAVFKKFFQRELNYIAKV